LAMGRNVQPCAPPTPAVSHFCQDSVKKGLITDYF
jgi:hypothetical protein